MKIVINISKKLYDRYKEKDHIKRCDIDEFEKALDKCIILPKGYGRLIDADALVTKMEEREEKLKDDRSMWETACVETALDMYAPTIIEADKESEQE